jgi:copper homeostasis protein
MLLEIIALDAADARNALEGGADRVELVSDMAFGGLSPYPVTVAAVRAAVDIPIRVMLRLEAGFLATDHDALRRLAKDLRAAGADEFVLGFLDPDGAVDLAALDAVLTVLDGAPWTFHRAIDHAADRAAAWRALDGLPFLDFILTAGAATGLADGLPVLLAESKAGAESGARARAGQRARLLAGGGLREPHLATLAAAGITAVHSGRAVRPAGDWAAPVDPVLVRRLRSRIDAPAT